MVYFGALSNIMPYSICQKLDMDPKKRYIQIVQLDHSKVKILGELRNVLMRLFVNP